MKTIPVSLILAALLAPGAMHAQEPVPAPPSPGAGRKEGGPGRQQHSKEAWKVADKDGDGFIARDEFAALPRTRNLPDDKRGRLFDRLDKNGDGKLGREELRPMRRPQDGPPPVHRLWELDSDKSGGVSFEEFKQGPFFKRLLAERQTEIFRRLDSDGDGVITPKDKPQPPPRKERPRRWRPEDHGGPKPQDPVRMIRQLDKDGDGALSFEEFRAGPAVAKLGEDEQEDRFEAIDRNHDQKLTPEDFAPPPPPQDPPPPVPGGGMPPPPEMD